MTTWQLKGETGSGVAYDTSKQYDQAVDYLTGEAKSYDYLETTTAWTYQNKS